MKKIIFLIMVFFLILLGFSFLSPSKTSPKIIIGSQTFQLYLAKTAKEREIGLSKYQTLPKDYGMLFLFEKPDYYSFWMKDMKFPIDIIFIDKDQIVAIYGNVKPQKSKNESLAIYQSSDLADRALEINEGLSQKYGFKRGDKVKLIGL